MDVYPIFNGPNVQFVPGIPAVPHIGVTKEEGEALLATGAFTKDPPPEEADQQDEGPADAGPVDSKE